MRRPSALACLAVLITIALLPSCSGTLTNICERDIQCTGGNDKDVDACVATLRGAEDAADAYDCSDAFSKQVDCVSEKVFCKDGKLNSEPCKSESEAINACTRAASAKKK